MKPVNGTNVVVQASKPNSALKTESVYKENREPKINLRWKITRDLSISESYILFTL